MKSPAPQLAPENLIDRLLAEQAQLQTPVADFSAKHHRQPDLAEHYRSLIPLTQPGPGEQYAFEVSLDRCTGCKACVSACHSLNGLDEDEAWRDVGTLLATAPAPAWQQTITSACHHCEDPGCMNGCPVGAYEKDPTTGIVRHLDDQCIGCSYCILKCPYDVPKYSKSRGIVRKCDMCHQRLAEGEAPACVQACPTEAIRIVKVTSGAPTTAAPAILGNAAITRPTTLYVGRPIPTTASAADQDLLVPQPTHWPLVLMLVLTQAGIGLLIAARGELALTVLGGAIFFAGMLASVFHLGQPLKAWRFFIGLRTSWLSREILAFSLVAPLPIALASFALLPQFPQLPIPPLIAELLPLGYRITAASLGIFGLLAVFTSVMIYHDTQRSLWRMPLGAARFFGTVAGFAALGNLIQQGSLAAAALFVAMVVLKMIPEIRLQRLAQRPPAAWTADRHSARLQSGPLWPIQRARFALAIAAVITAPWLPWLALPLLLAADLCERRIFFQSVAAPKMPGNFGPTHPH
jgi:formate dehydrogenase iron-sulfur subunit